MKYLAIWTKKVIWFLKNFKNNEIFKEIGNLYQ